MKKINLIEWLSRNSHEKQTPQRFARYAAMLIMLLTLGVGQMWGAKGFFSNSQWKVGYWTGGSDTWSVYKNNATTLDLGVQTTLYLKGCNVQTWNNDGWTISKVVWYYGWSSKSTTYSGQVTGSSTNEDHEWYISQDRDLISIAPNNPGNNTLWMFWRMDDYSDVDAGNSKITFTIPGFTNLSTTSVTFDNTTVGSSSSKSITYKHYGTDPTNVAARYSITGTDAGQFSITALSGTGATIMFSPTSAGTKTAKLVINDVHGKTTSEITLTGTTQYTVSYNKGSYGTGDNTTANKVYGTNLTLLGETFTRTGYTQTAWNTNAEGTGGTSYDLNEAYSADAALTLYPTWTVNNYAITYSPSTASHCTYTTTPANANYGSTVNLTIKPDANYVISSVTAVDASSNPVSVTGTSPNYSFTMPASDVTVTVVTAPSAIAVNYGAGANGSLAAEQNSASIGVSGSTVAGGSTVNFTATPNTGYEIEGWYSSYSAGVFSGKIDAAGTSTTYNAVANSTLNVYVKFKLSTYDITYENMTGAMNHASNPDTYNYESSDITLQTPTKEGYTFGGWFTDADLAPEHEAGTPAIANHSTGDKTFYAKWTGYSYTVRFNANGGSGSMDNETGFVYGTNKALTANAFTRPGYTFSGWATATDGEKVYDNSQSVSILPASDGATIDLYAVWTERLAVKVYFAKPADWEHVYAYAWEDGGTANASWPGIQLDASVAGTGTEIINCATYYYYKYYTDGGSADIEGEVGNSAWNKVIFNNGDDPGVANNTKTGNLTLTNGNAYGIHTGMQSTSASGYSTSAKWTLRGSFNDWSGETYPFSCADDAHTYSVSVTGLTASTSYEFKIWGPDGVAYKYTGGKDASYNDNYDITSLLDGRDLILNEYSSNNNTFTAATTGYTFTIDVTDPKHPVLTVVSGDEANYSATLRAGVHGSVTNAGAVTLHHYATTSITATPEPGYRFLNWTSTGGGTITFGDENSATTTVTATADGATITANFTNDGFIYFDRSAVNGYWSGSDVYFTLFENDYNWPRHNEYGKAIIIQDYVNSAVYNKRMNRIPNTNIYYYDITGYTEDGSGNKYSKILFTDKSQPAAGNALNAMGAAPCYGTLSLTNDNMYVVENYVKESHNDVGEYVGYWMKYNENEAGITLKIYGGTGAITDDDGDFTLSVTGSRTYTATVTLSANTTYRMELQGYNGTYYKNNGTMVSTNCTAWPYVDHEATVGYIITTAGGDYDFTLNCADKLYLTADFPLAVNDYRLLFNGKVSTTGSSKAHPSEVIRHATAEGIKKDTLSFFVVKDDSWTIQLQRCTSIDDPITWANVGSAATQADFSNPATGVYNFVVKQDSVDGAPITPEFESMAPVAYSGNYYIRTDAADGGWEAYKKALDNLMVFSNYSKVTSGYDHYHCKYKGSGTNVKFTIANDYSTCISDTFTTDSYLTSGEGILPAAANVRFMWNSETNVLSRAYLNGSHTTDFLVLEAKNDSIKNVDDTPIAKSGDLNQVKFVDKNNWVYQKEVKVREGTHIRLTSNYRFSNTDHLQYFKGNAGEWTLANTEELVGGTTDTYQTLRLVYDFKTNNLVAAWIPPTEKITSNFDIKADMLLIRRGQGAAQQITFDGGSIKNIKTMIGAIEFSYDSIVGRVGSFGTPDVIGASGNRTHREMMLYISFPFDVKVSDIYGIGQLNKEWYLQRYDGADRAAKGFFRGDGTTTFWKFLDYSDVLKAGEGYSLLLDNDYFNSTGDGTVWANKSSGDLTYLYFPSANNLHGDSIIASGSKSLTVPSHECLHDRTFESGGKTLNHKFTDSHWNMIGVPLFQNQTGMETEKFTTTNPSDDQLLTPLVSDHGYFYEWDSLSNNFSVHTTTDYIFKSMHGYMVQFTGTIDFTGASIQPASSVAARRTPLNRDDYTLELQLLRNNNRISRTYIELREEACDTFALNEDVYMLYTSLPADLFTFAGNYDVSANVLSIDNHVVPVGVEVHQAGEYTFAMPDNFSGSAVLVDTEVNTRTNLAISDYTVTLPKGVSDGRFFLELDINKMPTAIDGVTDGSGSLKDGKVHKFIENGVLYIVKEGQVFDARGNKVK